MTVYRSQLLIAAVAFIDQALVSIRAQGISREGAEG
jgi:hypothetical protein